MNYPATRFAAVPAGLAWLLIGVLGGLVLYGLIVEPAPAMESYHGKAQDLELYRAIIARMHNGEGYYRVAGEELYGRGYPTRPFICWRLPTLAWLMAALPSVDYALWLLRALTFVALLLWMPAFDKQRSSLGFVLFGELLLVSSVVVHVNVAALPLHEVWAGIFILLSLAFHAREAWVVSVVFGVVALLVRELALPFAAVMLLCAWREQRYREAVAWLLGVVLFGCVLALHASAVMEQMAVVAERRSEGWLFAGGWSFVLATARWNGLVIIMPEWILAVITPLALLGLAGWRGALGGRIALTVGLYILAFLFIGRPNNSYWGLVYAHLLLLGLLYAIPALADLLAAGFGFNTARQASVGRQNRP